MRRQRGQVLVFFALALPLVLLPVAAYAVDASVTASDHSRLLEVTVRAAEEAAQQIDVGALRSSDGISIDAVAASELARRLVASAEPDAQVTAVGVLGQTVRVMTSETVVLPFNFVGAPSVTIHVSAEARITAGYESVGRTLSPATRSQGEHSTVQSPAVQDHLQLADQIDGTHRAPPEDGRYAACEVINFCIR